MACRRRLLLDLNRRIPDGEVTIIDAHHRTIVMMAFLASMLYREDKNICSPIVKDVASLNTIREDGF